MVLLRDLKVTESKDIRYIFWDASENEVFERLCKQKGVGVKFEYTTLCIPQQNG